MSKIEKPHPLYAESLPPSAVLEPSILNISSSAIVFVAENPIISEATSSTHDNRATIKQRMLPETPKSPFNSSYPLEFKIDDIKKRCFKLEQLVKGLSFEQAGAKSAFTLCKECLMDRVHQIKKDIADISITISDFKANFIKSHKNVILDQNSLISSAK